MADGGQHERILTGEEMQIDPDPLAIPTSHDDLLSTDLGHSYAPSTPSSSSSSSRFVSWHKKKFILAVCMLALVVFIILDSTTNQHVTTVLHNFLTWVQTNPIPGLLTYTFVYFISVILFVPGSILTLGAGFVFCHEFGLAEGVIAGTIVVFIGAGLGAMAAFLLGRFLFRDCITPTLHRYKLLQSLDLAFEHQGFRIMVLLHLSPIIPFSILSYIAAVTSISFKNYVMALIAIIPSTLVYVFLGASAGSLAELDFASLSDMEENETLTIIIVVVGALFGILAVGFISYYAKKEIEQLEQQYALEHASIAAEQLECKEITEDNDGDKEMITEPEARRLKLTQLV